MITRINFVMLIFIAIELVHAQEQADQHTPTSSNFQPSLFVVIGVLSFMFSLTLMLLIYAKFCHRRASAIHNVSRNQTTSGMFGNSTRFSGIDKKVVESLPFFRFSSLKGAKQGLQCAVCLAEFEEVEVLRLLPKCKHGFHIECVDLWLERHSTCPLCRRIVSVDDLITCTNSSSMRYMTGCQKSDAGDVSSRSFELFLERENSALRSSRFSLGGSFRRIFSSRKEEEIHIQQDDQKGGTADEYDQEKGVSLLHRLNHQIVVSDVMFKNRWSDVSSSDLMFLNSEMLGVMSSDRITSSDLSNRVNFRVYNNEGCDSDQNGMMDLREEMMRKMSFEDIVSHQIKRNEMGFEDSCETNMSLSPPRRSSLIPADKRSLSEITALSRFKHMMSMKSKLRQCLANSEVNNSDNDDDYVREDLMKRRKKWFPIAKRTVQWFANREKNRSQQQQQQQQQQQHQQHQQHQQQQQNQDTSQILDV